MNAGLQRFIRRARRQKGATLVEYTFIVAIVSIAAVIMLSRIGQRTNEMLELSNTNFPQ